MILSIPPDTSTRSTIATRTHSQRVVTDRLAQLPDNISNSLPDRLKLEGEKARRSSSPDSLPLSWMSSTFHLCLHGVSQATVPQLSPRLVRSSMMFVSPWVRNKCESDLLHWIFPNITFLYFLQNSIAMGGFRWFKGRRQNYTFWCYLFLETRFLVKVHMNSNENNLYDPPMFNRKSNVT